MAEKKYPTNLVTCRYCRKKDIDRNKQIKDIDWVNPSVNWFYHAECYKLKKEEESRKQNKNLHDSMDDAAWKESVYYFLKNDLKIVSVSSDVYLIFLSFLFLSSTIFIIASFSFSSHSSIVLLNSSVASLFRHINCL